MDIWVPNMDLVGWDIVRCVQD